MVLRLHNCFTCVLKIVIRKRTQGRGHNSYLWTYDLYNPQHNAFDAGKSITGARGNGFARIALRTGPY
jgi:hypothetical protein